MSLVELASFVSIFTGRAVGPRGASFLVNAAVCKHLWKRLAKYIDVYDTDGNVMTRGKFGIPMNNAGASVTCGLGNQHGIPRRIIMDDHSGIAMGIANLSKFASSSRGRLCAPIPAYVHFKTPWQPSGLVTTVEQAANFRKSELRLPCS